MKWLTFARDGEAALGALRPDGQVVDVQQAAGAAYGAMGLRELIARDAEVGDALRRTVDRAPAAAVVPLEGLRLLPPVPRPGKIICLAGNYREHIVESGFAAVEERDVITPQMFLKPSTCLIGDRADIPLRPANARAGWEVELAVVVGRRGRDLGEEDALAHVFGYTIFNDVSERALYSRLPGRRVRERDPFFDWLAGKWFDGFAPCGPWIVTADEMPESHALGLRLRVNGETRQAGSTADMIFRIPRLLAEASAIMTLEPGDLIATGTPVGAGTGFGEAWLQDGDEVVCEIDGIGRLRNRVRSVP